MPRWAGTASTRHPYHGRGPITSAAVLRGDNEDWAVCVVGYLAGHRTHHQLGEAAHSARAYDQHVGVLARVDELVDDESVHRLDRDRLRAGPVHPGQYLVRLGLGRRAGLFGPGRVIRVHGHLTVVTPD